MLLLLGHVSPAGPVPATSPCPPREKGQSGCLIFPGWASSQTTSPCCSHRQGCLFHSPFPRAVDSSPPTPLSLWVTVHTGCGQRRQARDWGLNSEVQSLFHCMTGQAGGILTEPGSRAIFNVSSVLPMKEYDSSPAVLGEGSSSQSSQTSSALLHSPASEGSYRDGSLPCPSAITPTPGCPCPVMTHPCLGSHWVWADRLQKQQVVRRAAQPQGFGGGILQKALSVLSFEKLDARNKAEAEAGGS